MIALEPINKSTYQPINQTSSMIKIRNAHEVDLPAILEIYNDIILTTTAVYDYLPHTLEMRKDWWDTKQKGGYPVFLAEENERILGFSSFGPFRAWAAYKYSVENSVYVHREARGKGIGKLLLSPIIETAKQMKFHTILAGIDANNEASLRLHSSFGFTPVAHFREVGFKFDHWLDLKFLQLLLDRSG
jgi:phosphinothricin acetyltransferase